MKHILWSIMLISLCGGCQTMEPGAGTASVDSTANLGDQDPPPFFIDATVSLGVQDPIPLSVKKLTDDHLRQRYLSVLIYSKGNVREHAPAYPFTGTADDAFSGQWPPKRGKGTYFYNFTFIHWAERSIELLGEEIQILRKMASGGDRIAGARLYQYYTKSNPNPELAEEAIELAPIGNGINQYYLLDFIFKLPDGSLVGRHEDYSKNRFYLQKKQVLRLTSLSAMGSRPAAARLSEYFLWGVCNDDLAMLFWRFARGDDAVLPEIKELDAKFKRGDQELIRKSFSSLFDDIWQRALIK